MKSSKILFITLLSILMISTAWAEKAKEAPRIYDEKAKAETLIADAIAAAKKENRRVLIQWGANWCPWCHVLHRHLKTDQNLAKLMLYEYDLVLVDVGRRTKNMELAKHYGVDLTKNGIPFLTVLDSDGKVVANQPADPFEKADKKERAYEPAKLAEFLTKNQAARVRADDVLAKALKKAEQSDKRVFLHFGAPWCGWCRRLDAWLAQPDIAAILSRDFLNVKIDQARMTGGKEMYQRYCHKPQGIPWFVILDAGGKPIIDSDGPKGNIGYPAEEHEIAYFTKMMETARRSLTDSDLLHLRESLARLAKQYLPGRQAAASTRVSGK